MYGSLELKSLVDQRQEGALQAARTQRLAKQALVNRSPRFVWASANLSWTSVLSVLRGVGLS